MRVFKPNIQRIRKKDVSSLIEALHDTEAVRLEGSSTSVHAWLFYNFNIIRHKVATE